MLFQTRYRFLPAVYT